MKAKGWIIFGSLVAVLIAGLLIFFLATPVGKRIINEWDYSLKKTDEQDYENQKQVEDTCRAMIASYQSDKLIYEQYKDSEIAEERSWANNAKIRANQTATSYNTYILKNSFVWKDNVPWDIKQMLEIIV